MIDYDSRHWFTLLFRWRGSILPRILPEVIVSIGFSFLAYYAESVNGQLQRLTQFLGSSTQILLPTPEEGEVLDDHIHSIIIYPLAFLLVFRTAHAYSRYW